VKPFRHDLLTDADLADDERRKACAGGALDVRREERHREAPYRAGDRHRARAHREASVERVRGVLVCPVRDEDEQRVADPNDVPRAQRRLGDALVVDPRPVATA
jgi:hypothetical protein